MQRVHKALASAANSGKLKSLEEQTKGEQQFGHPQICRLYAIMVKLVSRSCVAGDFRANRRAFEAGGGLPFRVANLAAWSFCSKLLLWISAKSVFMKSPNRLFGEPSADTSDSNATMAIRHYSPQFSLRLSTTVIHKGFPTRPTRPSTTAANHGHRVEASTRALQWRVFTTGHPTAAMLHRDQQLRLKRVI